MEEELDLASLKYVLYARKSTDDPQRQVRSITDQIRDCQRLIDRLNLNIVKVIQETKSAKKPNQRPEFVQMLKDLRAGKYDGIVSWNPDRLARNMKEGGEIIDMIDEGYIKDLRFETHHFSNDANGKMLLGMAFVLSKQYSDDLSQKVTRGMRGNLAEGKSSGTPKHGYLRDEEGLYRPDGKNFELIKKAWQIRKEGISLDRVAKFLLDEGYTRKTKKSGREILINDKILTEVFRDPFYYGVLVQAKQKVDLRVIYDFIPAVSEEDYLEVQNLTYRRLKPYKPHKITFYPLRLMILCSYCSRNMYVGPSTGSSKIRYLNARCDTEGCIRGKKSIRMKEVFDFIYKFLDKGLNFTRKDYEKYEAGIINQSEEQRERISHQIHSKQGLSKRADEQIDEIARGVLKLPKGSPLIERNNNRATELEEQKEQLEKEISDLKSTLSDPEEDKLSVDEFLNLSKNAARVVKAADAVVKDRICRKIFLNFKVDEEKVLSYQLKEPFATLLKGREIVNGRGDTI